MIDFKTIRKTDSEIADVYAEELNRQRRNIELIASETNTPRDIRAKDITADAFMSTRRKLLPSSVQSSFSAPSTPTCSRIAAQTPILPFITLF